MAIDVRVIDGSGKDYKSEITEDGEDLVISASYPPLKPQKVRPFRQYLTDDGTVDSGSEDMAGNFSVTNQDFFVTAHETSDRYITTLNFLVGYGTTGQPNEWGDGTALSVGSRLFYSSIKGEVDIHNAIKSNQDLFRLSFNQIPTAWELRHVDSSNDYGYFITLDLTKLGLSFGIKLDAGTTQRLAMTIRDNTGASAQVFNVIAYGFERFK